MVERLATPTAANSDRRRHRDLERASGDTASPGQLDRLLERLERRSAQCTGEGIHFSHECSALGAAGQVAIDERLLDAREVAVQPEGDPLPDLVATVPYFRVGKGHIQCDERIAIEVRSLRKTFLIIGESAENEKGNSETDHERRNTNAFPLFVSRGRADALTAESEHAGPLQVTFGS